MRYGFILTILLVTASLWANDSLYQALETASDAEKVLIYQKLASYYHSKDLEKSVAMSRESIYAAQNTGDEKLLADALYEFGYVSYRRAYNDTALVYVQNALEIYMSLNDSTGVGKCYNRLGNIFWHLENQVEALKYVQKAITVNKQMNNPQEYGMALNSLANMYRSWGDYIKAIDLLSEANQQYELARSEEGIAWLNFSMTLLCKRLGNYDAALKAINSSLAASEASAES